MQHEDVMCTFQSLDDIATLRKQNLNLNGLKEKRKKTDTTH